MCFFALYFLSLPLFYEKKKILFFFSLTALKIYDFKGPSGQAAAAPEVGGVRLFPLAQHAGVLAFRL